MLLSDLSVPESRDGIGTFSFVPERSRRKVAKASSGHYPLPFLISDVKNCGKNNNISQIEKNFSFNNKKPDGQSSIKFYLF